MAQNDIKYKVGIEVDGVNVVHAAVSTMKDLGNATTETGKKSKSLDEYTKKFEGITENSKSMKRELSGIKKLLSEMEFNGMAGTEEFQRMSEYAGQLSDAIGDANANVKYFADDTRHLQTAVGMFQGVAGAISVAQGALALFDSENKAFEQTMKKVQGAIALVNGVQSVANVLNKDSNLIIGVKNMQRKISIMLEKQQTVATVAGTAATKGATIATKALNAVMKANPIGLVITALTTVIGLFAIFTKNSDEATDSLKKQEDEVGKLTDSWNNLRERVGNAAGEMVSKFQTLAVQWSLLRTEGERMQWIKNNANNFEQLGLKITDVTTANKVFIDQLPRMITLMQKMGELKGLQDAYAQIQSDYFSWLLKREKSVATGDYFRRATEQNITQAERETLGVGTALTGTSATGFQVNYGYEYSKEDLEKVNQYRAEQAKQARDEMLRQAAETYGVTSETYRELYTQLYGEVEQAREEMNNLLGQPVVFNPMTASPSSGKAKPTSTSTPTRTSTPTKPTAPTPAKDAQESKEDKEQLTRLQKLQEERAGLVQQLTNTKLTPLERDELENKLKELDDEIKFIKTWKPGQMQVKGLAEDGSLELSGVVINKTNFENELNEQLKNIDFTNVEPLDITQLLSTKGKNSLDMASAVYENAQSGISAVRNWLDMGAIGKEKAQELIDAFNMQLESMGLKPIQINIDEEDFKQKTNNIANTVSQVASSVATSFDAINQLFKSDSGEDEPGLMVGKIIAQTLATLALSFANAMSKEKTGVWGWIAAGLTGTATLISMLAQIKSATQYATGGIVGGNSVSGDKLFARVNSGEMILNKLQQQRLFGMLNGTAPYRTSGNITPNIDRLRANSGGTMQFEIQGRKLVGVLANETRISGRSGRRTNIKI